MQSNSSADTPNIVVLDGFTLNPGDLDWAPLQSLGNVKIFEHSTYEQITERAQNADIILSNKAIIDEGVMQKLPQLKCICLMATGYNNIDITAAKEKNIAVCNAVGYGSDSVAQHVFALVLTLTNQVYKHHESVQNGKWSKCRDFSYTLAPIQGLAGKTFGIYGFGKIGQKVGEIAHAFGMKVIAHHKHPERDARPWVSFVGLKELFEQSDVLSLHAPLNESNKGIINATNLAKMKSTALLINTGRGGLVNELDLKEALEKGIIAGAGLDVLSQEPPPEDHLLSGAQNCIITPHNAWASRDARQRLFDIIIENIEAFLDGKPQNIVY